MSQRGASGYASSIAVEDSSLHRYEQRFYTSNGGTAIRVRDGSRVLRPPQCIVLVAKSPAWRAVRMDGGPSPHLAFYPSIYPSTLLPFYSSPLLPFDTLQTSTLLVFSPILFCPSAPLHFFHSTLLPSYPSRLLPF